MVPSSGNPFPSLRILAIRTNWTVTFPPEWRITLVAGDVARNTIPLAGMLTVLKRQSTTAKVTRRIARLISEFCRETDNGVMVRIQGEEIGLEELDEKDIPVGLCIYKSTLQQLERLLSAVPLFFRLIDCKTTDRYVLDHNGNEYWVFGLPSDGLLVRRVFIQDGQRMLKPVRTMEYNEVASVLY